MKTFQLDSHLGGPLEVENVVKSRDRKITYKYFNKGFDASYESFCGSRNSGSVEPIIWLASFFWELGHRVFQNFRDFKFPEFPD